MPFTPEAVEDDAATAGAGRFNEPFSITPAWVTLNATPQATAIFNFLRLYVFIGEDKAAMPLKKHLAKLIGVDKEKSVTRYLKELENLGAITIERRRIGGVQVRNHYLIHQSPPPGFDKPVTKREWLDLHFPKDDTASERETTKHVVPSEGPQEQTPPQPPMSPPGDHTTTSENEENPSSACGPLQGAMWSPPGDIRGPLQGTVNKIPEEQHTHTAREADDSTAAPEPDSSVCAPDEPEPEIHDGHQTAARNLLRSVVPAVTAARMTEDQRDHLIAEVAVAIANGWTTALLAPRLSGAVNDKTEWPYKLMCRRLSEVTSQAPQKAAAAAANAWGTPGSTDAASDPDGPVEIAVGVRLLPDGTRQIRYRSCGGRDCTGGSGGMSGTYRRRIDPDTGAATMPCTTTVTLPDGRTTTCHPDAVAGAAAA